MTSSFDLSAFPWGCCSAEKTKRPNQFQVRLEVKLALTAYYHAVILGENIQPGGPDSAPIHTNANQRLILGSQWGKFLAVVLS